LSPNTVVVEPLAKPGKNGAPAKIGLPDIVPENVGFCSVGVEMVNPDANIPEVTCPAAIVKFVPE